MPLTYLRRIAETPAPTFAEGIRATLILQLWRDLGYQPILDDTGNVILKLGPTEGTALVLAAHLDTVFHIDTDVRVVQQGRRWVGPGLGDNSASLAVLTAFLRDLRPKHLKVPLWLVANVGEEGLGDLYGMKALLAHSRDDIAALVAVDGYLGLVVNATVGSRRWRVRFRTPGGHSWGDDQPSALHAMALAIAQLYRLPRAQHPRTTLNVGVAEGGTSVNSIAAQAYFLLDLRSLDAQYLQDLEHRALETIQAAARSVGATVELELVGDRAAGSLHNAALMRIIQRAAAQAGVPVQAVASSTDANAAVPYGLPAVALGVYTGGQAHRLDEWVQPQSLATGLKLLKKVVEHYQLNPL